MAASQEPVEINMPSLPAKHDQVIQYLADHPKTPMLDLLEPYKRYDAELRKVFAQQPDHEAAEQPNIVPVFAGHEHKVKTRARDLENESKEEQERYIMPLKDEDRRPNDSPAIVQSLRDFKTNFTVFSESSLVDLDWSNVVAAGSAVVTCLLAVPEKHAGSKRALRQYYHEQVAPASDVDLFLYGLTEEQAIEKIKQIERNVRDALLVETTTIRTKNTVTIASKHPVRHVQIVLRIYKSISEILTGFDVDCSCACFDGNQVYASPRALGAYMTQINTIDLTRRSPSYENRLSKYAHRGFEVYWPSLDRSRVDPTIFERSFARTEGLARLLILEKLPRSEDREDYMDQRRAERGRPAVNRWRSKKKLIPGDIKNDYEDEVAEWVDEEVSNYHSVSIPYGPNFHARKIEKLLFTKDLLLNAEWNKPKDREVNLHRHPAFFGTVEDVIHDCCGYCPQPSTVEEEEVAEEESKSFISGDISFMKDDPGRQEIGSFHPLTADDWTTMAYVGNTALLCQAIVDADLEYVQSWLNEEGNDPNTRDFTGRAPLHLAVSNSTIEIVQALIDAGARLIARLVDGKTALHLAAIRGRVDMVSALLRKSEANEEEEEKKVDARRAARKAAKEDTPGDVAMEDVEKSQPSMPRSEDSDIEMVETADAEDENMDKTTENSMVDIKLPPKNADDEVLAKQENDDDPDVYDINVTAWDTAVSPLHLAIAKGHIDVVKCLVQDFGADVLLPIKIFNDYDKSARAAILTLVLAFQLPTQKAEEMARTLIQLGASSAQADVDQTTVLQYSVADTPDLLNTLGDSDAAGVMRAINHLSVSGYEWNASVTSPLMTAIQAKDSATAIRLLKLGAKPEIDFAAYIKAYQTKHDLPSNSKQNKRNFEESHEPPVLTAVRCELPLLAKSLIEEYGVDPNTLTFDGHRVLNNQWRRSNTEGKTLLDQVQKDLKDLEEWQHDVVEPEAPLPLKNDTEYLSGFEEDTYSLWSATKQLESARKRYKTEQERYEERVKENKDRTGVAEKQKAIDRMARDFKELEKALVERGAKTFYELHPEVEKPEKEQRPNWGYHKDGPKPFSIEFDFKLGDLTEQSQQRYERLFEAAWNGDLKEVKQLTLVPWKNEQDEDEPPSQVAVQDQHNLSPFSIAAMRGHFETASGIMEIAKAQHVSAEEPKQRRYALDPGDSEDESVSDDGDVQLYSEIVDDEFTVENIGEVSMHVKSRVLPETMLSWRSLPAKDFSSKGGNALTQRASTTGSNDLTPRKSTNMTGKRTNTGSIKVPSPPSSPDYQKRDITDPDNLIQFAVYENNPALLRLLLELGQQYKVPQSLDDNDATNKIFEILNGDFEYALEVGHASLIGVIVKVTGAGIYLSALAKRYGIDLKEKPKYYQGLSVYGKKRQDWARRGYDHTANVSLTGQSKPLLTAAHYGSLESVEWLLSDTAIRCYNEFAEANKDDKRLQQLSQSKIGFSQAVEKFLTAESHKVIHCCLASEYTAEADSLMRYLLKVMPDCLEAKSSGGYTPLHVAFDLYREEWAKLLIDAGANLTCRDKSGRNILHSLLDRDIQNDEQVEELKRMLDIIDKRVLPTLFLERSTGSVTPLQYWLKDNHREGSEAEGVLKTILAYGGGKELSYISGEGDTPLHCTVKKCQPGLARIILEHDASLLNRENSTGRTPYEMAEDAALSGLCDSPPPMPNNRFAFEHRRAKRLGLHPDWYQDVMNRQAKTYVEERTEGPSDRELTWNLLQETKAKLEAEGNWKRRLVTLNEANEVARRLAAMKSGSRVQEEKGEEDAASSTNSLSKRQPWEGQDQVGRYMDEFKSSRDW